MGTNRWDRHDTWPPPRGRTARPGRSTPPALFDQPPMSRPVTDRTGHGERRSSWPGGAVHMHPTRSAGVIDQRTRPRRDGEQQFTSRPADRRCSSFAGPVSVRLSRAPRRSGRRRRRPTVRCPRRRVRTQPHRRRAPSRPPDEGYDHLVDLWSTYATIRRGQRLGLTIGTSGWPRSGSLPKAPSTLEVEQALLELTHLRSRQRRRP